MPEGDTIARTAAVLARWLVGRTVTAANSTMLHGAAGSLVGREVAVVEARAKHLLMTFTDASGADPIVLRTHMRMTGSWHVYVAGDGWRRSAHRARIVIEAGDHIAVGFDIPEAELTDRRSTARGLGRLGPDVLAGPLDLDEIVRRARHVGDVAVADVLLDQRVSSGIGNVYRSEGLFLAGLHPGLPVGRVDDVKLRALYASISQHMRTNVAAGPRNVGLGPGAMWVYRRTGRPCRRCSTAISSRPQGPQARIAYWCSSCQPGAE